jgi:hypothetical protein
MFPFRRCHPYYKATFLVLSEIWTEKRGGVTFRGRCLIREGPLYLLVHLKSSLIRGKAFVERGLIKGVLNVHLKGGHSFIVDGVVLFMWYEQFKVEESCHIYWWGDLSWEMPY